jgi:gamma-glutamyltranspeptidase/glutathione hydrolase
MMGKQIEQWQLAKPAVRSAKGVVAAQNFRAAEVGAQVLRGGGNAVDAAVATAFALGVVEPWMSGLGGVGYMMVYLAAERRTHLVDFAAIAPKTLDPAAYPLTGQGTDSDLFGWPEVEGGHNVHGPLAIGAPGAVAGFALALEMGARLEDLAETIHAHPTQSEGVQEAALKALGAAIHG